MKKFVKIILIVLVVLIALIAAAPFLFKDKILALAKNEINKNINAVVDFREFGLTLFSSFPNLTVNVGDLLIVGVDDFAGDTLAAIQNTSVILDLMSVISGDEIKIRTVSLNQPRLNFLVLEDGRANWDIVKPSSDTSAEANEPSKFKVALKKYGIRDGYLNYNDASLGFGMVMAGLNHEGSGDFTQDLFTLVTKTNAEKLTVSYGGVSYILNAKTNLAAELEMDMANSKYTFKQNELVLNDLAIGFDGYVSMPGEDIITDLKFDVRRNDFRNFISMIPGMYRDGFDNVQSSGKLALSGFVKGTYNETSMPGFGLTLNITNGMFRYPDLPTALNNVLVDLSVNNPDGVPDHTNINLKKLHVEVGAEPFDAMMTVTTPVSDANINLSAKGKVNLEHVAKLVPLEEGTELKGLMNIDLTMRGKLSSIETKKYENFDAGGNLNLDAFSYKSRDFKQGVSISSCQLIFNPKNITLNKLDLRTGNTDLRATGWLDNFLSYMFKENELLKGTLDIKSNTIDMNELMGESTSATQPADTTTISVFEVPEYVDFLLTAQVGKVLYDDLVLENARGNLAVRDRTLGLNGFSFGMLQGQVTMEGLYETKDVKKPFFYFDLNLNGMDIPSVYSKFVAVRKLAPIAEKCSGKFSASMNVKGNLDEKSEPVYTSLNGGGKLSSGNVTIENFTPLVKVADALKMDQFKKMQLKDINLSFKFENGRVALAPFDVNIAGIRTTIEGSNGFDQTIDYNLGMNIPVSMMGNQATGVVTGLIAKANQATGANMSLGKEAHVNVKIGGTVSEPKVETNMKEMAASAVTDIKTQVKEQLEEKKKELEDKAKAEADRLKQEAEAKAKAEADRLKKEAEEKAKAEADRLKKEAEERAKKEAEDKLKNLFGKPKK